MWIGMIRNSGTGLQPRRTVRLKRAQFERKGPGWVGGISEQICGGESLSLSRSEQNNELSYTEIKIQKNVFTYNKTLVPIL